MPQMTIKSNNLYVINNATASRQGPIKRVLFIVTVSEFGGAQKFLYNFLSNINLNNYEILLATGRDGDGKFTKAIEGLGIKTYKLNHLRRSIKPFDDFKAIGEIRRLITEFIPDSIFLNSSKAGAIGAIAAKKFPLTKVIYRIGGWQFNDPLPWIIKKLYIYIEKFTAKYKDIIILNNAHDVKQAKDLKIKPKISIELIHNGIDTKNSNFVEKNEARLEILNKIKNGSGSAHQAKFIIGTIANFYKTKGLVYLIEAMSRIPEEKKAISVIIGDGLEKENLKSKIEELGLKNKVFLVGKIQDASKYLKAFDIFILPSVKEGSPWTILEAMSAKLPIIATTVGGIPEMIEDGKSGLLVSPRDSKKLAKAINEILTNYSLQNQLSIGAHQKVLFSFDQEKMIKKIEGVL